MENIFAISFYQPLVVGEFSLFSFQAYGKSAFYGNRTKLCFTILLKGSRDLFLYRFCKKLKDSAKVVRWKLERVEIGMWFMRPGQGLPLLLVPHYH